MKRYVELLSIPLLFLVIYTTVFLFWPLFGLPTPEELTVIVKGWFDSYGLAIIFFGAALEGTLLIGSYFPGVFVIFLGVAYASSAAEATLAIFTATLGLMLAHILNYCLGKYGWHRLMAKLGLQKAIEQAGRRLEKRGPFAIPLSYWLPSIGALVNTAAGIMNLPFKTFLTFSLLSSLFWYSLVGVVVYQLGDSALSLAVSNTGALVIYLFVLLWMAALVVIDFRQRD